MRYLTLIAFAAAGIGVGAASASALPFNSAVMAAPAAAADVSVDQVRLVCGPYRCFYRPGFYRPYGYGWRRPWGWRGGYGWRRPYGWRRRFY